MCVYKYLNKINTFKVRNYYTLGKYLLGQKKIYVCLLSHVKKI